jgi:uncharacterized protein YcfL
MKKLLITGAVIALTACTGVEYDKDKFHLTSDVYYISELSTSDTIRESDGFKVATITGKSDADTEVFYRVLWFDTDGNPIKATTSKSTKSNLRGEQPFYWTAVSPNADATKYKVFISGRPIEQ